MSIKCGLVKIIGFFIMLQQLEQAPHAISLCWCVHACMCACVHTCMCACVHAYVYVCVFVCVCVYTVASFILNVSCFC